MMNCLAHKVSLIASGADVMRNCAVEIQRAYYAETAQLTTMICTNRTVMRMGLAWHI